MLASLRSFNLWRKVESRVLGSFFSIGPFEYRLSLYEQLCRDSRRQAAALLEPVGLTPESETAVDHSNSHIAVGNKNFTMRNRDRVTDDGRWFLKDEINTDVHAAFSS